MISFIISIIILVLNTVLVLFLKRINKLFSFPAWMLIVSLLVALIGLTFIIWQGNEIENELNKRNWTVIEGEIITSEIVGKRALRTEVQYQYSVNDTIYFGKSDYNIPGFGSKNYRRKNARIVKNANPVGMKIKVYYNPFNPEKSILRYGPYWSNYMILAFGTSLLLIGVLLIELQIIAIIKKKER